MVESGNLNQGDGIGLSLPEIGLGFRVEPYGLAPPEIAQGFKSLGDSLKHRYGSVILNRRESRQLFLGN